MVPEDADYFMNNSVLHFYAVKYLLLLLSTVKESLKHQYEMAINELMGTFRSDRLIKKYFGYLKDQRCKLSNVAVLLHD